LIAVLATFEGRYAGDVLTDLLEAAEAAEANGNARGEFREEPTARESR
jgi:hypothetical protein